MESSIEFLLCHTLSQSPLHALYMLVSSVHSSVHSWRKLGPGSLDNQYMVTQEVTKLRFSHKAANSGAQT